MAKVIAIGGVSRAGKSSLALWLHQNLKNSMMLCQDDFPQPETAIPRIKERVDWEHPDSINWPAWKRAIESNFDDCDYLILEGLFMFRPESEVVTPSIRYYLTMDKADFIVARKEEQRWGEEPLWFIEHVWESHFMFGVPGKGQNATTYHRPGSAEYQSILREITG